MNRKDKSVKIGSILDKLYPETPVPLRPFEFVYFTRCCDAFSSNNRQESK